MGRRAALEAESPFHYGKADGALVLSPGLVGAERRPIGEIAPPVRRVRRYCPGKMFPPYRYVPGVHPHPVRDPRGHSHQEAVTMRREPPWEPEDWRQLTAWLWGVDLFNAFYFWEAHEAWEGLWAVKPRGDVSGVFLQGLIQISAALLKIHLRSIGGAAALSGEGLGKLESAAGRSPVLLGLDLRQTRAEFQEYFRPLAVRTLPPLDASVPALVLMVAERSGADHGKP